MRSKIVVWTVLGALAAGCSSQGWRGAEAEKAYDKELETLRLAAQRNNDDYYEIRAPGRITVISDVKDYREYQKTGELPLRVTRIGAGPNGETVIFALLKTEAKAMEGKVGFTGGAQNLYEGKVEGLPKNFYAQVEDATTVHVFDSWAALDRFRRSGQMEAARTERFGDRTVRLASGSDELLARFRATQGQ